MMPKVRIPNWTLYTHRRPGFLDDEVEVELPLPLSSLVTNNDRNTSNPWALKDPPFTVSPEQYSYCLLYTSPSPRDATLSRMPSSA